MNERIKNIWYLIEKELNQAPSEELLSDEQNEMYAEMQNLKESFENVYGKPNDKDKGDYIINEDNIDDYRYTIDRSSYYDCIKMTALDLIECSYSYILESNRFSETMLENIASEVCENEEFNNYIDSQIMQKIDESIFENKFNSEDITL